MTTSVPHFTRWPLVEGYCSPQSYLPGDVIGVRCASRARTFRVEVTRVGGTRERVWEQAQLTAFDHAVPADASASGCGWPVAFRVPTQSNWASGFYEVRFLADDVDGPQGQSEAFFVLREVSGADSDRKSPLLVLLSTNTYNAYNQWGGECLYSGATQVSFDRPIERGYLYRPAAPRDVPFDGRMTNVDDPSDPTHQRLLDYQRENAYPLWCDSAGWHNWERRFVEWAEAEGFELAFAVDRDLIDEPDLLRRYRTLVTVGHSEYWSWEMRDAVDDFVERGGHWFIAGGDTCTWQVRYESSGSVMVCFKSRATAEDPDQSSRITTLWSAPRVGRPETISTGLTFTRGGYYRIGQAISDGDGAFVVHRPNHWLFAGMALSAGARIGGRSFAVGYEVDGCALVFDERGRPHPTREDGSPEGMEILATAPARMISITDDRCEAPAGLWASLEPPGDLEEIADILFGSGAPETTAQIADGFAVIATFRRGAGTVVHVGSADWAYGLDDDSEVQTITANVLRRLSA